MPNKIGSIIGGAIGGGSAPLLSVVTWVQIFDACIITACAAFIGGIIGYCVSRFMHRHFDNKRVKRNK